MIKSDSYVFLVVSRGTIFDSVTGTKLDLRLLDRESVERFAAAPDEGLVH
jgi:hypothetical protein